MIIDFESYVERLGDRISEKKLRLEEVFMLQEYVENIKKTFLVLE